MLFALLDKHFTICQEIHPWPLKHYLVDQRPWWGEEGTLSERCFRKSGLGVHEQASLQQVHPGDGQSRERLFSVCAGCSFIWTSKMCSAVNKLLGKDFFPCLFPVLEVRVVAYLLITFFGGEDFHLKEELTERGSPLLLFLPFSVVKFCDFTPVTEKCHHLVEVSFYMHWSRPSRDHHCLFGHPHCCYFSECKHQFVWGYNSKTSATVNLVCSRVQSQCAIIKSPEKTCTGPKCSMEYGLTSNLPYISRLLNVVAD